MVRSGSRQGALNGRWRVTMQTDGNLVVKEGADRMIWASNSFNQGQDPYRLRMGSDGNLVIYDRNNKAVWNSNTRGVNKLVMEDDGNLVIYDATNTARWANGKRK